MSTQDSDEGELPSLHALAWGLRERPTKGPRRALSLEAIVAAGVELAVQDGLAAVSMGRVASAVGASTMALYRYLTSKDDLVALMIDTAVGMPPSTDPAQGWRAALSQWTWGLREIYLRHPWALQVPIAGPPSLPNQLAWFEAALVALRDTGLKDEEKIGAVMLITGYVRSEASLVVGMQAAHAGDLEGMMRSYSALLRRVVSPHRYPELSAMVHAGVFDEGDDSDTDVAFGIDRLLDGLAVLIDRQ